MDINFDNLFFTSCHVSYLNPKSKEANMVPTDPSNSVGLLPHVSDNHPHAILPAKLPIKYALPRKPALLPNGIHNKQQHIPIL